jgi:hypothetical protein
MDKGIKFLVEMELGNAPEREFIVKNLKVNPEDTREERNL